MKNIKLIKMEETLGGDARCETLVYGLMGLGAVLSTSIVAAPLGITVGGLGLFLAATGACPTKRLVEPGISTGTLKFERT